MTRDLGGRIKVKSGHGAGSVFTVHLPKAIGAAAQACNGGNFPDDFGLDFSTALIHP